MIDLDRLRRALVLGALGAVATALLLPPLAALRHTDAQDWYAARKVSVAQALIAVEVPDGSGKVERERDEKDAREKTAPVRDRAAPLSPGREAPQRKAPEPEPPAKAKVREFDLGL